MSAINNLRGHVVRDGKVIYAEPLSHGLQFVVVLMYEPYYAGQNAANHQNSSQAQVDAFISTGKRHTYGNGVSAMDEAETYQRAALEDAFPELLPEMVTANGFRVWQAAFAHNTYAAQGYKIRTVKWLVEVPKTALLNLCLNNSAS